MDQGKRGGFNTSGFLGAINHRTQLTHTQSVQGHLSSAVGLDKNSSLMNTSNKSWGLFHFIIYEYSFGF